MTADPTDARASHPGGYTFYVTIDGAKQGMFKGTAKRTPGTSKAIRFSYEVEISTSPTTGSATGRPKYNPVRITKEWDAASPQLFQAAATNESLKSVLFEWIGATPEGKETIYYQIKLTNAAVSQYKQYTDSLPEGGTNTFELEDVSFTFQKIEVMHPGGMSASATTAGGRATSSGSAGTGTATTSVAGSVVAARLPARLGITEIERP